MTKMMAGKLDRVAVFGRPGTREESLTVRERACLILSGKGQSEKEIAQSLEISPNTVRVHIENVKRKLGAENKSHAIVLSLLRGLTKLTDFD